MITYRKFSPAFLLEFNKHNFIIIIIIGNFSILLYVQAINIQMYLRHTQLWLWTVECSQFCAWSQEPDFHEVPADQVRLHRWFLKSVSF